MCALTDLDIKICANHRIVGFYRSLLQEQNTKITESIWEFSSYFFYRNFNLLFFGALK